MSTNQRQFFRCPLSAENSSAVLSFGWKKVACKLVEISIGGFAVVVPKQLRMGADGLARLKAAGMDYVVQVTHQKPVDNGVLVGLKQLEEVAADPSDPWTIAAIWLGAFGVVAAAAYILYMLQASLPQ